MNLGVIAEFQLTGKLLRNIENENTAFSKREGVDYKGWFVDYFDLSSSPAYITANGRLEHYSYVGVETGLRPSVKYSKIKDICTNVRSIEDGCLEVTFGEYPQMAETEEIQARINHGLVELEKTGKSYTVYNNNEENPGTIELAEMVDKNGNKYVNKNDVWYKVAPVKWIVDEKEDVAITKNVISGGIPFGMYEVPTLQEWEKKYKLPPSIREMHERRRNNPTIIEGFLNAVLSYDILTKDIVQKLIDRDVKAEETRLIAEQKKLIAEQEKLLREQERVTKEQEKVSNQLQELKEGNIGSITSKWEKKVPSQMQGYSENRYISNAKMYDLGSLYADLGISLKGLGELDKKIAQQPIELLDTPSKKM